MEGFERHCRYLRGGRRILDCFVTVGTSGVISLYNRRSLGISDSCIVFVVYSNLEVKCVANIKKGNKKMRAVRIRLSLGARPWLMLVLYT
jgi:hypothetical protein